LRRAVFRFAGLRLATLRFAVFRFAGLRLATLRFAVFRRFRAAIFLYYIYVDLLRGTTTPRNVVIFIIPRNKINQYSFFVKLWTTF